MTLAEVTEWLQRKIAALIFYCLVGYSVCSMAIDTYPEDGLSITIVGDVSVAR